MSVGKRLREARRGKFTQDQVAEKIGIDNTTISKYENDKSEADNETLRKLSDLYKVSLHWILTGEGEKTLNPNYSETELDKTKKDIMQIINENLNLQELELTLEVVKKMLNK